MSFVSGDKTAVGRLSHGSVAALRDYLAVRFKLDGESGKQLGSLPLFTPHGRVKKIKSMSIDGMRSVIQCAQVDGYAEITPGSSTEESHPLTLNGYAMLGIKAQFEQRAGTMFKQRVPPAGASYRVSCI